MMSMGPALIGEEMDDSVDLTPGHMFHHISVYWLTNYCRVTVIGRHTHGN